MKIIDKQKTIFDKVQWPAQSKIYRAVQYNTNTNILLNHIFNIHIIKHEIKVNLRFRQIYHFLEYKEPQTKQSIWKRLLKYFKS